jgi:hypothetical protein
MRQRDRDALLDLLHDIAETHPLMKIFRQLPRGQDGRRLLDLITVLQRLENNEYRTRNEVFNAVDRVWIEGQTVDPQALACFTEENRRTIARQRMRHGMVAPREWGAELARLRNKLSDLLAHPTPTVSKLAQVMFLRPRVERPKIQFVEEIEYRSFIIATENMTDEELAQITALARANEPETVKEVEASGGELNVAELRPHTFRILEKCAKEQFKAKGVAYPLLG